MRLENAIASVIEKTKILLSEMELDIDNVLGKVSSEDVISPIDYPPYDRSAVDGYAVCSDSITSASPSNPIPLKLKKKGDENLSCEDTIMISTGERIDKPFDSVVMLEDVYVNGDIVYVMRSVPRYANISRSGEDFRKNERVIEKGMIIRPWHMAILSAIGRSTVKVYRDLKIGIITTGSEIRDPRNGIEVYEKGLVLDSTSRLIMATLLEHRFIKPRWYGICPDNINAISKLLFDAVNENDIVITTGGTGPGTHDITPRSAKLIGADIIVQGIAMRPGRPTSIAIFNGKPIFMLSGFPVAAYVGIKMIVLPFIAKYFNIKGIESMEVKAKLVKRITGSVGYDTFVRVKIYRCGEDLCAEPIMLRGSGMLSSLTKAKGFLRVPLDIEGYERGDYVWIQML